MRGGKICNIIYALITGMYMSQKRFINYTAKERGRSGYFRESDIHNKTFYYNALDTEDLNGCDLFQDTRSKPVDEQAEESLEHSLLFEAIKDWSPKRRISYAVFTVTTSPCARFPGKPEFL